MNNNPLIASLLTLSKCFILLTVILYIMPVILAIFMIAQSHFHEVIGFISSYISGGNLVIITVK